MVAVGLDDGETEEVDQRRDGLPSPFYTPGG
uniref:Uncharacterized protein n=1 Tax=Nelumbo nucifera TaxID=4432 RepID=A0A822ZEZ2_NELNU|nr:TPA_asm: hypothetical protein HUJ06_001363 [Nelumbo nucifera]